MRPHYRPGRHLKKLCPHPKLIGGANERADQRHVHIGLLSKDLEIWLGACVLSGGKTGKQVSA